MPMTHVACDGRGCKECDEGWVLTPISAEDLDFYRELSSRAKENYRDCPYYPHCVKCREYAQKAEEDAERAVRRWMAQGCADVKPAP